MKTSEIFAACISPIQEGKFTFICHALFGVGYTDINQIEWNEKFKEFLNSGDPRMEIIKDRLSGCDTLEGFIYFVQRIFCELLGRDFYFSGCFQEEMREFRVLWLKSLVEEFQLIGD